jgi:periplasmic protein TonB
MTKPAGPRTMSGALSALLHLVLLALVLAWRPLAGWKPPSEPPLTVELEAELPPPPLVVEPEKPSKAGRIANAPAPRRSEPRVAADASTAFLPPQMPSAAPSGMTLQRPESGGGKGQAQAGSGAGGGSVSGSGTDDEPRAGTEEYSLGPPAWIVKPSDWEMQEVNPDRAKADHVSGGATLGCLVNAHKRAHHCLVLQESPGNYGFGNAALRLSPLFRIKPPVRNGRPRYDVRVRIPVYFENLK